ncbi:MAG TPA: DEAD/DEAH box helicase, partial [Candidatus Polarisedimenticolia bacterium]|nr:DEAD/DEAH box helicase [Candidatus Polarisedimenticolia bacterium]
MNFTDLGLRPELQTAIDAAGYVTCTPVQEQVIPEALKGRDITGMAQTGTGKTAAFVWPILARLAARATTDYRTTDHGHKKGSAGGMRALIVAPTRELVVQIEENV